MRGYSPTEPAPDGRYDSAALSEDALALIDALGYKTRLSLGMIGAPSPRMERQRPRRIA